MAEKGRPLTKRHKRRISEALRKRSLGNHTKKGAKLGAVSGGVSGAISGAFAGGAVGGPIGALAGAAGGGAWSAGFGSIGGAGYGAATYATRKKIDGLRKSKKYTYDYSSRLEAALEFGRGRDKKKRRSRGIGRALARTAVIGTVAAAGGAGALYATKGLRLNKAAGRKVKAAGEYVDFREGLLKERKLKMGEIKRSVGTLKKRKIVAGLNEDFKGKLSTYAGASEKALTKAKRGDANKAIASGVLGGAATATFLTRKKKEDKKKRR